MFVTGTSGHVDHGKSSLILALTGIDPDRLPAEKERGMTIDLGFAWLALPDGKEVGIVDVPGHERFIKNMVAGVGAINLVLFVVAADDGWMPQSQEHLEILKLLDLKEGIIVLTKIDLVEKEWLKLVEEQIREKVRNSFLKNAPVIRFSSVTKEGLGELKTVIWQKLNFLPPPEDIGKPRLYIDRVFTLTGIGTIVTGTLIGGAFSNGQEVEILPQKIFSRIRGLQTHKREIQKALPGNRVAINLAGVSKDELRRGNAVFSKNSGSNSSAFLTRIRTLPDIKLKNSFDLSFLIGTDEVLGNGIILDKARVDAEEEAIMEVKLKRSVVGFIGDRFIFRQPTPQLTLGGGVILDVFSIKSQLKSSNKLQLAQQRKNLDLKDLILSEVEKSYLVEKNNLLLNSIFSQEQIFKELEELLCSGKLERIDNKIIYKQSWDSLLIEILSLIEDYSLQYPHHLGITVTELGSRLQKGAFKRWKVETGLLDLALNFLVNTEKKVVQRKTFFSLPDFEPQLPSHLVATRDKILGLFESAPFTPPTKPEILSFDKESEEVLSFLVYKNELVELKDGILLRRKDFQTLQGKVFEFIKTKKEVTVGQVREYLGITRKYALPILEKLDEIGLTQRIGDKRILNPEITAEKLPLELKI